jgi:tetratricopeptide (TPR) repeat protein
LKKAELMSAKTVEKEPSNSTYLDTYAWIFYMQGNYSLAKFYIERAIDNLKPDYDASVIYDHYGDILWKSNNPEKAKEMWKKALEKGMDTPLLKIKIEKGIL